MSMAVERAVKRNPRTESYSLRMLPPPRPSRIRPPDTPLNLPSVSSNSDCLAVGPRCTTPTRPSTSTSSPPRPCCAARSPAAPGSTTCAAPPSRSCPSCTWARWPAGRATLAALRDRGVTLLLAVHPPNGAPLVAGAARAAPGRRRRAALRPGRRAPGPRARLPGHHARHQRPRRRARGQGPAARARRL